MRGMRTPLACAAALALSVTACGGKKNPPPADIPDASTNRPDGNTMLPKFPVDPSEIIDGTEIDSPTVGESSVMRMGPNGQPGIAYGAVPDPQAPDTKYQVWYAQRNANGTWTKELVVRPAHNFPVT